MPPIVMVSDNGSKSIINLSEKYPNYIGQLFSPKWWHTPQCNIYALDNGAFSAWKNKTVWDEKAWWQMLYYAALLDIKPKWVLIPDVVANKKETLKQWDYFYPKVKEAFPEWFVAFAAQDGMRPNDVPKEADVVFIGGTMEWKLANINIFCDNFNRIHVGRISSYNRLKKCLKAESVDGNGWYFKDRLPSLIAYCMELDMGYYQ